MESRHSSTTEAYKPDSLSYGTMVTYLLGIVLLILVSMLVAKLFYSPMRVPTWAPYTGGNTAPFSARQLPNNPRPRLQVDEIAEYKAYLNQQNALLTRYSWIDKERSLVRIPVDQAIKRLVEKGLPARRPTR